MLDRLFRSHIWLVSREEYQQHGSLKLLSMLDEKLRARGKNPYLIPVGGSNWCGTWGYINAVAEIQTQLGELEHQISDIVIACGSAGSACGIALGVALSELNVKVHAFSVCDDPQYFYDFMDHTIFRQNGKLKVCLEV